MTVKVISEIDLKERDRVCVCVCSLML